MATGEDLRRLVWVASFPKSGNTWVRAFTAAYRLDAREMFDLTMINAFSASESRVDEFTALAGKPREELSELEIDVLRRFVQERLARILPDSRYIKTHNARVRHHGYPLIRAELTRAAIYLVRNPLDVVDSLADHAGMTLDQSIALMNNAAHRLGGPRSALVTQHLGTWSQHVASWTRSREFPVLVLKYEQLKADPRRWFAELVKFLGWELDHDRLDRAIRFSSFKSLQQAEEVQSFSERSERSRSGRFFRRGVSNGWQNILSRGQAEALFGHHGEVMRELGYPGTYQEAVAAIGGN